MICRYLPPNGGGTEAPSTVASQLRMLYCAWSRNWAWLNPLPETVTSVTGSDEAPEFSTSGGSVPGGRWRRSAIARSPSVGGRRAQIDSGMEKHLDDADAGQRARFDVLDVAPKSEEALKAGGDVRFDILAAACRDRKWRPPPPGYGAGENVHRHARRTRSTRGWSIISAPTIIVWGLRSEKEGIAQPQPALAPSHRARGPRTISCRGGLNLPRRESDAQGRGVAGRVSVGVAGSDPEMPQHSCPRRRGGRARHDARRGQCEKHRRCEAIRRRRRGRRDRFVIRGGRRVGRRPYDAPRAAPRALYCRPERSVGSDELAPPRPS